MDVKDFNEKLGQYLAECRGDESQRRLSDRCGVQQSDISRYENGITQPSVITLYKMYCAMPNLDIISFFEMVSNDIF